jgi:hypothetical protein
VFEEFTNRHIKTAGAEIFLYYAGTGPGVLLVHG